MKANLSLFATIFVLIFFASCTDDAVEMIEESNYKPEDYKQLSRTLDLPEEPFEYTIELPKYMQDAGLSTRTVDDNRATLGRVLFYDKSLSKNGSVSCASCHKQELAFADNARFSKGFEGKETPRNSLGLGAVVSFAAFYGATGFTDHKFIPFLWDERASTAVRQSSLSFTDSIEMGMTRRGLVNAVKSKSNQYYGILFEAAYGDPDLSGDENMVESRILWAVESFIDGMGTYESKLDKAITQHLSSASGNASIEDDFSMFTAQENRGKSLFIAHCESCHGRDIARPGLARANNGLDLVYADKGVGANIFGAPGGYMYGVFKVPGLRNIAVTAPYMHDGRFATLEEVLDFYSSNIQDHQNLHPRLRNSDGMPKKFNFSEQDKQDIIAFFNTMTDAEMMSAEKYADPFK